MQSKVLILDSLHSVLSHNVIGDKQYEARYKGFSGELSFSQWCKKKQEGSGNSLYSGGFFLANSNKETDAFKDPLYITITSDTINDTYRDIYNKLDTFNCKAMFFVHYDALRDIDLWDKQDVMGFDIHLPVPEFKVYEFKNNNFEPSTLDSLLSYYRKLPSRSKNAHPIFEETKHRYCKMFSDFDTFELLNIYVERLIIDGFIGFGRDRGSPTDIDAIIKRNNEIMFVEVKEKYKSNGVSGGFGMDIRCIDKIRKIIKNTSIPYFYMVKEVSVDRSFLNWKSINMETFFKVTDGTSDIVGGDGMRSSSTTTFTKICPYVNFKTA